MKQNSDTNKSFQIRQLEDLAPLPLGEKEIIQRVLEGEDLRIVNLRKVSENYKNLISVFPYARIYTAVKALSTKGMLEIVRDMGSRFEVAGIEEFQKLIKLNIKAQDILFSHPDRDALETKTAFQSGLNFFVSDSMEDLQSIAEHAPGSKVLIRLSIPPPPPVKPENTYNRRFGVGLPTAKKLLLSAQKLKLQAQGLAFHIGTQLEKSTVWEEPIQKAGRLFREMQKEGIHLDTLDLGGGFPAPYAEDIPQLKEYSRKIKNSLDSHFENVSLKNIILEPGRSISGTAGVTVGRVIRVKTVGEKQSHFVAALSTGRWSAGLIGVGYKMNFYSRKENNRLEPLEGEEHIPGAVYGKASSALDHIHNTTEVPVPKNLKSGDIVVFSGTGAYTDQMSAEWCSRKIPTDILFDSRENKAQ